MKKLVWLSVIAVGLFMFPGQSLALYTGPGSSPSNPIYVQQDPRELYNYYSGIYGSDFTICHGQCAVRGADTPNSELSCINYAVSCAQRMQAQTQSPVYQEAMRLLSSPALTPDQTCQKDYGAYAKYAGYLNNQGGYMCSCKDGYEMNGSICVQTITVSPDQACMKKYGSLSIYSGKLNDQGGYICDCRAGYTWNQDGTACILNQQPVEPPKTETPSVPAPKSVIVPAVKASVPVKVKEVKKLTPPLSSASTTTSSTVSPEPIVDNQVASPVNSGRQDKGIINRVKNWIKKIFKF
ncbi:MAG: hypothetical protein KBC69_00440 [Candidatus Magasanikbacteria bacterium]|nr:hypothetical protein [Candidatus Magasanikbacteria bacterium]